ncbi:MAG: hypothetical protein LBB55_03065 [Zoogloeaceae bacterium]|jgi:hypothetical protein|nr:hypothetical protein [Zoogloeaceae bacterium]
MKVIISPAQLVEYSLYPIQNPCPLKNIVALTDRQRNGTWQTIKKNAGVENLHFHDSKHEAATHAIGIRSLQILRDTYYNADAFHTAASLPISLRQNTKEDGNGNSA